MIFDDLRHVKSYYDFSTLLNNVLDFILSSDFTFENPQTCKIGTEGIYAIPQCYTPTKKVERSIEAHRKYIDIQVMIEGREYLGYAAKHTLRPLGYDEEHDLERLKGTLAFLPFPKGFFAVLFPKDAHMPGVQGRGSTSTVKKIVVKVPTGLWLSMRRPSVCK